MKFLRTPEHKRLVKMLTAARKQHRPDAAAARGTDRREPEFYFQVRERRAAPRLLEVAAISRPKGFAWRTVAIAAEYGPSSPNTAAEDAIALFQVAKERAIDGPAAASFVA